MSAHDTHGSKKQSPTTRSPQQKTNTVTLPWFYDQGRGRRRRGVASNTLKVGRAGRSSAVVPPPTDTRLCARAGVGGCSCRSFHCCQVGALVSAEKTLSQQPVVKQAAAPTTPVSAAQSRGHRPLSRLAVSKLANNS